MPRPKKPTPAQARKTFEQRIQEILERYKRAVAAAQDHPTLTTYWRRGYNVPEHRVTGHWVVRARSGKKGRK